MSILFMTLEDGLNLIENYKKALQKFLDTLPEQSVQLGSEMIQTLTMNSKNEMKNLDAIEKALKKPPQYESGLSE
ncbi:hypothetical protein NZNM25_17220 [Nitrosopumilus zosterae]|uniref:Uncharacterized protein n=2 Tax=Nitrosopumilaceae TaxID=338190 RepID=A0A2S2KTM8_9ARCH|nr:hypothetical protein NZNM25_17220 [Nitrosopumilus zosterae]